MAKQPERLKCWRVGELLVNEEECEKPHAFFFVDRDMAEAWATFKNLNVSEDVITDPQTIAYYTGPRHRQDALEYFLKVGLFDDDATRRAKEANRPYLITREDVLAGRVRV